MIRSLPSGVIAISYCPIFLSASGVTAADDVAEVRGLGFAGVWVKHSPPKRVRNASAVSVSGKQNRIKDLLDIVSISAAADWDASFTMKRINL
jgi:hypothetical protein